ncbi:keratin, type I cuticular Ha2-like [Pseudorca crassidens]|uniref:keratin, type I cuticular Ha2-like n=1 Tax=Pseudorca crassidens TaxID=82174 RepID=UPI00352DCEF2
MTSNCSPASIKSCPQSPSVCSSSTSCRLELCLGYVCQPGIHVPLKGALASSCQPGSCRPTSRSSGSTGSYSRYFEGSFNGDEKETMQFLNNHLASYLERVRQLERDNAQLESRIRDASRSRVLYTEAENARMIVHVDNARVAADVFRTKYEMGLAMWQLVEADTSSLCRVLDELTLCKADLEMQVESLKEELMCLKKNHEEEVDALRCQLGDRLNVDVDAATPVDLNRLLEETWCQYGALMEALNQQVATSSEQLQSYQPDINDLRQTVNTLEIEVQAQHSLVNAPRDSLESTLAETEARYSSQLAQMQCLITNLEVQLADIHCDLERQSQEYRVLLDVQARLEFEINTYRGLLESEDCKYLGCESSSHCLGCTNTPGARNICVSSTDIRD